jgi:large subunit ribosomal protein L29
MMNPKELAQKTSEELARIAADLRAEIRETRFKVVTRQHAKVRTLRLAKRDLARTLTAMNAKKES